MEYVLSAARVVVRTREKPFPHVLQPGRRVRLVPCKQGPHGIPPPRRHPNKRCRSQFGQPQVRLMHEMHPFHALDLAHPGLVLVHFHEVVAGLVEEGEPDVAVTIEAL